MARIRYYINYKEYKFSPKATKLSMKQSTKFAIFLAWLFIPLFVVGVPFALISLPLGISNVAPIICRLSFASGFIIGIFRVIFIAEADTDEYARQDILRQLEKGKPCQKLRNYMYIHSISEEQLKQMLNENKFN